MMCRVLRRVTRREKSPELSQRATWSSNGRDLSRGLTRTERPRGAARGSRRITRETYLTLRDSKRLILSGIGLTLTWS